MPYYPGVSGAIIPFQNSSPVTPFPVAATEIIFGGQAITTIYGNVLGGVVSNPFLPNDQGIAATEALFVDLVGEAALAQTATTRMLRPGESILIPPGDTNQVSVNAATSGHKFSAIIWQSPIQPVPTPIPGANFPPVGPLSLTQTIPSYLYQEYNDDDNLQDFVDAYNGMAQQYVDWFNQINLPIYTGPLITGLLLDWVAQGLYGISRPTLSSGQNKNIGTFNTWAINTLPFDTRKVIGPQNITVTTDDIFKRIITWHFYKGDGKVFNVRWLKRRIMRFLLGENGTAPNIDNTYQISVTFGLNGQVNITILNGVRVVTGGAMFNRFGLNTTPFNRINSYLVQYAPLANAEILVEAINSGALELPFQFTYVVEIG